MLIFLVLSELDVDSRLYSTSQICYFGLPDYVSVSHWQISSHTSLWRYQKSPQLKSWALWGVWATTPRLFPPQTSKAPKAASTPPQKHHRSPQDGASYYGVVGSQGRQQAVKGRQAPRVRKPAARAAWATWQRTEGICHRFRADSGLSRPEAALNQHTPSSPAPVTPLTRPQGHAPPPSPRSEPRPRSLYLRKHQPPVTVILSIVSAPCYCYNCSWSKLFLPSGRIK